MLPSHLPIANSVLASLPRAAYLRLLPYLECVELVEGAVLCDADKPLQYVYFPCDTLISLLTLVDHETVFAVALVGREGMTSVASALAKAAHSAAVSSPSSSLGVPQPCWGYQRQS